MLMSSAILKIMPIKQLTIKQLTQAVGGDLTPRMVRHYHQLGLLSPAERSLSNYRLYSDEDVQRLRRIVALKSQGFQLNHIRKLLESQTTTCDITSQLQLQYQSVMQQLVRLRQTASALEGLLGRDRHCQHIQKDALVQLRQLEIESNTGLEQLEQLWDGLDAATDNHPEQFDESIQGLLPDFSERSPIELDLLSKLVLACGDVSLAYFVRWSENAIANGRDFLQSNCQIVVDVASVAAALDHTRLAHLSVDVKIIIDEPHITNVAEAEEEFWQVRQWQQRLENTNPGCILIVGYAPSVLMSACNLIEKNQLQPSLIIGMPIGFSHAPAAKRRLMRSSVEYITTVGTNGGGLLAAVALNALAESVIEKPHCHCYKETD